MHMAIVDSQVVGQGKIVCIFSGSVGTLITFPWMPYWPQSFNGKFMWMPFEVLLDVLLIYLIF
jgi:hypothetical protein